MFGGYEVMVSGVCIKIVEVNNGAIAISLTLRQPLSHVKHRHQHFPWATY